ncbi:phosphatidylinositol-4- kinase [Myotisia sp. PD_48]|nr:phosphatidylinositol-4- kinase [Myotisia sp. PD_48]
MGLWRNGNAPSPSHIRHAALAKLATLAIKYPGHNEDEKSDVDRLIESSKHPANSSHSHSRDLDLLFALCKSAPSVHRPDHATKLVSLLTSRLPTIHTLQVHSSPFLHTFKPSPWETLTHDLISALLSLGSRYKSHRNEINSCIDQYLENCLQATESLPVFQDVEGAGVRVDSYEATEVACLMASLVGFLNGASTLPHYWSSVERLSILTRLRTILSEQFLIAVETISSTIRNSRSTEPLLYDWRRYSRQYAADGRALGSILLQQAFMAFVKACTTPVGKDGGLIPDYELLDHYMKGVDIVQHDDSDQASLVRYVAEVACDQIYLLEEGSDYLQVSSAWQQRLAFSVKALSILCTLNCIIADGDAVDLDILFSALENTFLDAEQMLHSELATVTLKAVAILARLSRGSASSLTRSLLRFIVQSGQSGPIVSLAAHCIALNLQLLSQDVIIGTLYSLGNVLSSNPGSDKTPAIIADGAGLFPASIDPRSQLSNDSLLSLSVDREGDMSVSARNVTHAIVTIATTCNDNKIIALAQSMLVQKIGKVNVVVDAHIIQETAALSLHSDPAEFQLLLKFYARLHRDTIIQGNNLIVEAIHNARIHLAKHLNRDSQLLKIYLVYLLEHIVNQGAVIDKEKSHPNDAESTAQQIVPLLKPTAILLSKIGPLENLPAGVCDNEDIIYLLRDAWFNIAAHDISLASDIGRANYDDLLVLAEYSPSLVSENRTELLESDIELNTVLRRGQNPQATVDKKRTLSAQLPALDTDIRRLTYPKALFLNAALLIETLRATSGTCTGVYTYFLDPIVSSGEMGNCMKAIADKVVTIYLERILRSTHTKFSAPYIAQQLADTFIACCHRIKKVQQVACLAASRIVHSCPSSLCEKRSLFTLLDLLSLLWSSCLEEDLDEFAWKSCFVSPSRKVQIELSDNYEFRRYTLNNLHKLSRSWVVGVMNIAPLDIKGLLQTYLSDYEDDGAYGHVSIGRSLALEIGATIPFSNSRLDDRSTLTEDYPGTVQDALEALESRIRQEKKLSLDLPRHILRKAAALLCNSDGIQTALISHLVNIPFQIFTRESIKTGISLWLGVINENPRTEPRIIVEVAQAWERTIHHKQGIFDANFKYIDPFMAKLESLPSDKEIILKRQRQAQNLISPHFRVLQFFESHFNASRLGSIHTQRIFRRLVSETLTALRNTTGHPLAREIHFHIIQFSLKVLRHCSGQSRVAIWKLKDQCLSAALSWFAHPPRWSLGGNRLQMKAEDKILHDIQTMLETISWKETTDINSATRKSLEAKHNLVQILIANERSRLKVWLTPIDLERRSYFSSSSSHRTVSEESVSGLLRLAWNENPSIALHLTARFPSEKIRTDVRWLLINFPEKTLKEPDALEILLGSSLPDDVSFQLKYLLYWQPTNPITALTYILPAYGNHPFILQYAMRALESHAVDVGFFYIPQLVQALRYDALGYIERHLLKTAQLSPSFAHQVIWNMKANAFKDEDSQIPDPVKPVLDRFMGVLIGSFTEEDREYYEKEFEFFNEITGISGTLRPYIKRSKQEKKEKIEEELRKIKVEVGVYLPSNPEGVVIGIDRKSGKPLQSHAKAPYMATFRIRKTRKIEENGNGTANGDDTGISEASNDNEIHHQVESPTDHQALVVPNANTYEVWQSAIFKVGDDCRQDVLALQMIAAFRGIFSSVGLDVFVYPYRVVATAPGCGVIDVLPNSISRDMLGREAVNGLYDYFITKYGGEQSIRFQEARSNFVKSMAAYSVISYLLQFKDRHNGNIMVGDAGHIIHIDFGFCFDIAPGGIKFERAPFKLTSEMMAVMCGRQPPPAPAPTGADPNDVPLPVSSTATSGSSSVPQSYRWFESLMVKAFLASRPHHAKLSHIVTLMLDSGLPCFTPDTLSNLRDRFVLEKSEVEAAQYMRELIHKSISSTSTKVYDYFQLVTNSIPY